ncbi:glutamate decarboxylase [Chengkuizengella axinellae]|uniref:Glutamate decarboxylase n=1 Tax=Chengkuizengella axinellae TaxID=3064388 RepID=A0ABT9J064_9BACL|nr:glutamate decarboxylase [Chengkuizengella sp. 2205SS18-9]MDP5274409.1 glutamate decarboxylase [Chengkuizengella sp. 2205SS18-9]
MWTVIYIAPTEKLAERLKDNLTAEGFFVKVKPSGLSKKQYEILVPEGEVEEVQEVLSSLLRT